MKTRTFLTLMASALLAFGAVTGTSAADKVKPYPKKTCLVTDNKLGSMGTPVTKVYGDQEVKFCCKSCISKFEKDQAKFLAKLNDSKSAAAAK